jgi:hypothetical protein
MASVTISDLETILDRLHSLVNLNERERGNPSVTGMNFIVPAASPAGRLKHLEDRHYKKRVENFA